MNKIEKLIEKVETINKEFEESRKGLSNADLEIADITHAIEFGDFDIVRGYHLAKILKNTCENRRIIKNKYEETISIKHKLDKAINEIASITDKKNNKQKVYTFRTDKFKKMFGEKIDNDFRIPIFKKEEPVENAFIKAIKKSFKIKK